MNKSIFALRRNPVPVFILFFMLVSVVGIAGWFTVSSSALQLAEPDLLPTKPPLSFAFAQIAKPTYTPLPTLAPPVISDSIIKAEVVSNSSDGAQAPPAVYEGNKSILVDISEQHMYVYEGDALVFSFIVSTGMGNSTRIGHFSVLDKIPDAYGATWDLWMPNWLGVYYSGSLENGIHALPILSNGTQLWAGYLGTPISFGCVVLGVSEEQQLYEWAEVGTPVDIQR